MDRSQVRASLLNVVAQYDHQVCQARPEGVVDLVSSQDKQLRVLPSTHAGLMANIRVRQPVRPQFAEWLAPRSV